MTACTRCAPWQAAWSTLSTRHTTHYSLLTTHHSLLATHYSLLTTHYSLLIAHYSPTLGYQVVALRFPLTKKTMSVVGETMEVELTCKVAVQARDALAKVRRTAMHMPRRSTCTCACLA